ncbi:putative Transposon TX1 [Gossypium australe]|uniref:Putative Transposon TX1 n=1 Tax=Gossypium australe TaxID=47621 RepID=A0A5B6WPW9_9ROSI|nr:putative Transposon TX1 [Gossypium australe]
MAYSTGVSCGHMGVPLDHTGSGNDVLAKIAEIQLGVSLEGNKEELFWEQRAHVNWLKNSDCNISFLHKATRNNIAGLENGEGSWVTKKAETLRITSNYFMDMFTACEG